MDAQAFLAQHRVMLAPMAGVSDIAFRQVCTEQGAQLAFTEMVSSKGLSFANDKTKRLLDGYEGEGPVGVQLFGHEPETMAEQARWVESYLGPRLAVLDINMGCPARKIVSKGDGASLMERPELAQSIVEAVVNAVDTPVSVKFRRGFAEGDESAPEFARMMAAGGASWVCVHGRFAQQMYKGSCSLESITRVVDAVDIPVIGNGDICSGTDAVRMVEQTGCDAVMIARGAEGNPWIFADVRAALEGAPAPAKPTIEERLNMAKRHARLLEQVDAGQVVRMRKHASWYCKGLPGAAAARGRLNQCSTVEEFDAVFDELLVLAREV